MSRYTNQEVTAILDDSEAAYNASVVQLALDLRDARDRLEADARALWAVRVLDAWALAPERGPLAHPVPSPHPEWGEGWYVPWGGKRYYGATPDAARLSVALFIYLDLPEAVRRELGECPT